jgi:hypothetical protein
MIEFHLIEKLWEYFTERSLKDYGLFLIIFGLVWYIQLWKHFEESLIFGPISINNEIISVTLFGIGSIICIIASIRDFTTIEISTTYPFSAKKIKEKKPVFRDVRQVKIHYPFEPITIDIIIKNLSGVKKRIFSFFVKRFDFFLEFHYPENVIEISSSGSFDEHQYDGYQPTCQKKIKLDDSLKHDSHSIPIQISPIKSEDKITLDFKIVAIRKVPKKYRSIPIAFFIWLFVPTVCSFEIVS